MANADSAVSITHAGRSAIVRRSAGHPEQYLYIECDGSTYFLGVLEPGMTRGDVKRMASAWMERSVMHRNEGVKW